MRLRALALGALCALFAACAAAAEERIDSFDVVIDVHTNGDITVTETIAVEAEGAQIRRGIFRDLPRYVLNDGVRTPYGYHVESVRRDGRKEPYTVEAVGNAKRIRIGDPDVLIARGRHVYEIRYDVKNQVRYFGGYDEVYWNATGTYWVFPIDAASARVVLPPGGRVLQRAGYTGPLGATGSDYRYRDDGDAHVFETTRPLRAMEGLTVAVGFAKGLVDPPSVGDRSALWWARNGAVVILTAAALGLLAFYRHGFVRVGRDPPKGPVFPRYAPPEGLSPAGAHHIFYRGLRGHAALIATLLSLAVKGRLRIDAASRKQTTMTPLPDAAPKRPLDADDAALEAGLFRYGALTLSGQYSPTFTTAYQRFRGSLADAYGARYFRRNPGYAILAIPLSVLAVVFAALQTSQWSPPATALVAVLVLINALFLYLLPAPTRIGQEMRTAIEGFRLYLETAEKLQLNAVTPGEDAPPPMTVERYEAFLPYAVALNVERPWSRYFEHVLPEAARSYSPVWATGSRGYGGSAHALNQALVATMASGVTSAMPQSSGSSGSGGGGSSGGGGGGGGGGGW